VSLTLTDLRTSLRTVRATRYVTPLREGGSLPAIVEADDLGFYVLKFRGAGQGPLALVAELIAGEIGRALGLKVPELVLAEVDPALGRNEEDSEIRDLLKASVGLNLGLDYLPGSITFDPAARDARDAVDADLASATVWFDAFVTNVDRTPRNPNLLWWHRALYLIDHGAALYFHHSWPATETALETAARSRFPAVRDHVLLPWASRIEAADERLRPLLSAKLFARIVDQIPEGWLSPDPAAAAPEGRRAGYVDFLTRRLASASLFVEEAVRARAQLV
jgi:hypothetical protein